MSASPIDFSKYEQAAPPEQIDFSKYEQKPVAAASPEAEKPSGVLDTLGREAKSAAGAITGIPSGIYHAFSEPATQEETAEAGGPQEVTGAKRIGLGIGRLTAAPVVNAAKWYGDAARGKIPNAYEQALSVAPEAIGQGAGTVIAGKLAQEAPGAIKEASSRIGRLTPKQVAQGVGGVGGGVAGHGTLSAPGVYYGGKTAGRIAEGVLGKDRANSPMWGGTKPTPEAPGESTSPNFKIPSTTEPNPNFKNSTGEIVRQMGDRPVFPDHAQGAAGPPEPPEPVFSKTRLGPDAPPAEVVRARGLGAGPATEPSEALGKIPASRIPAARPASFPPDEPTPRLRIPGPSAPNPSRSDLLDDQGVQQDMQDYLDKQGKAVYAREPLGTPKGEQIANFNDAIGKPQPPVKYTKTPGIPSTNERVQAEIGRVSKPLNPHLGEDPFQKVQGARDTAERDLTARGLGRRSSSTSAKPVAGSEATDDLTPILQKSLDAVRKAKKGGR